MRVFPASRGHQAQSGPNLIRRNLRNPKDVDPWRFRIRLVYQTRLMEDPVCDRSMIRRFTANLASQTPKGFLSVSWTGRCDAVEANQVFYF